MTVSQKMKMFEYHSTVNVCILYIHNHGVNKHALTGFLFLALVILYFISINRNN